MDYLREILNDNNIFGCLGEIGTDTGEGSTRVIWDYAQKHESTFFAVDTFTDDSKYHNVKNQLKSPYASVYKGFSTEVAKNWKDLINFLFIDGDHNFPHISPKGYQTGVLYDILAWHPFLAIGGIMAFHDYTGSDSEYGRMELIAVEYAIDTLMNQPTYRKIGQKGSIIAFQKTGDYLLTPRIKRKKISKSIENIWNHLDDIFSHTSKVIIYGTGASAKYTYDSLLQSFSDLPEIIFTDSFTIEKGVVFDSRKRIPLHDLDLADATIVIGSLFEKDIRKQLDKLGKIHLKDYCNLFEFVSWCHLRHLYS